MPCPQQHFPTVSLALLLLLTELPNSKYFCAKGHFNLDQQIGATYCTAARVGQNLQD